MIGVSHPVGEVRDRCAAERLERGHLPWRGRGTEREQRSGARLRCDRPCAGPHLRVELGSGGHDHLCPRAPHELRRMLHGQAGIDRGVDPDRLCRQQQREHLRAVD